MHDPTPDAASDTAQSRRYACMQALFRRRKRRETGFRLLGLGAIAVALAALAWLLISIVGTGYTAFYHHVLTIDADLSENILDPQKTRDPDVLRRANYRKIVQDAMYHRFPEVTGRVERRDLFRLVSASGATNKIRQMVYKNPDLVGKKLTISVPVSDDVEQLLKGYMNRATPESRRKLSDRQIRWIDELQQSHQLRARFNTTFFTAPDSRDPELAGIASAVVGSAMALLVAFVLAFPIGVGAAVYLDEFAPKNRFTDFIEININNLAAVPSIVFGLLGLAVFLNFLGMPRSAPLVGGIVLALMTFPTIIITTRASLRAVPPSIRDGALSVGASHVQAVFHHKLPLAAPGILTGSIIGMAQALGETAPLLMIGMVAFVTEVPTSFTQPATALPVQIFLWSDGAERAWAERTSAAIIVLLAVLVLMNGIAIFLRNRLQRRW